MKGKQASWLAWIRIGQELDCRSDADTATANEFELVCICPKTLGQLRLAVANLVADALVGLAFVDLGSGVKDALHVGYLWHPDFPERAAFGPGVWVHLHGDHIGAVMRSGPAKRGLKLAD